MNDGHPIELDSVAAPLYELERAEYPERNLPEWSKANRVLRLDARYRAMAAYQRGNANVKAVLVERIAQTLAMSDGHIWPNCENKFTPSAYPPLEYHAMIASIRQGYRHKAREVITTHDNYLDVNAYSEHEELRAAIIERAKAQLRDDLDALKSWRQSKGRDIAASGHEGDLLGDGRR